MIGHVYNPDERTARCRDCEPAPAGHGRCLWCGHKRAEHDGRPDPVVKEYLSTPDPNAGRGMIPADARVSIVKWSASACGVTHCACRTYEA